MSPGGHGPVAVPRRAMDARWAPPRPADPARTRNLVGALNLPRPVCAILAARGLDEVDSAKRFLRPRLDHLGDPAALADGPAAARRISRALLAGETILVHGDYDVDGISAAGLLTRYLRGYGGNVVPFVPHRLRDGYDFSAAGLDAARASGASLIVTVDCGTVAHEAVAEASRSGIDVVVTDHHTVGDRLPEAHALVNPQRSDCAYPDKNLCGAGVAYRVAELVAREMASRGAGRTDLHDLLDLVALATIADLVPLVGENRVLAHYGLRRMAESRWPGLRALLEVSEVDPASVTSGQVGFRVAPRINAAGRVGESVDALRLLLTDSEQEAGRLAARLDSLNAERRDEDRRTLEEALGHLERRFDPDSDFGVVLSGSGWHPGVIGIVASRVVEQIHRPVVMIALDGSMGRGSARSIPGFHLYEALSQCAEHLERFGGHRQAAGMDIASDRIEAFRTAFNEVARVRLEGEDLRPTLTPDADLDVADANLDLVHWLSYLGPHGIGNAGPLFRLVGVELEGARVVGEGHVKTSLRQGTRRLDAIGFGLAHRHPPEALSAGPFDALVRLERNEWRGRAAVQAKLVDLRPSSS